MRSASATARLAICALLLATPIALAGCGALTPTSTAPTETPTATPSSNATSPTAVTETSPGIYRFEDLVTGYAVTLPCEPEIREVETVGTGEQSYVASCLDPATHIYYLARGEISESSVDLRTGLLNILASIADGQIGASSYELGGLAAYTGETTSSDGEVATAVAAAGEDRRLFVLIVAGFTVDEPEVFFDSFEYLA